jgi:hypothetical protein
MREKLNVCLLNDSFPPLLDGVSNTILNYAEIIQNKLGRAIVATPSYPDVVDDYCFPVVRYPSIDNKKFGYRAGIPFNPATIKELSDLMPDIIHARAEVAGRDGRLRESFDYAAARAVANLRNLCEYCLPFVKRSGVFIAMKGAKAEDEIFEASSAVKLLGGKIEEKKKFNLYDTGERNLILIRKISQTPPKYPRPAAQIAKRPLE